MYVAQQWNWPNCTQNIFKCIRPASVQRTGNFITSIVGLQTLQVQHSLCTRFIWCKECICLCFLCHAPQCCFCVFILQTCHLSPYTKDTTSMYVSQVLWWHYQSPNWVRRLARRIHCLQLVSVHLSQSHGWLYTGGSKPNFPVCAMVTQIDMRFHGPKAAALEYLRYDQNRC